jgi:maleylacetoacetate isomerase
MKLYSYCRSSTSYRTRIALHLKAIDFEVVPVNLLEGEQLSQGFLKVNPLGGVPALLDNDFIVSQSLSIIDYLEQKHPDPSLYPSNHKDRAIANQIALMVAEDIHPLINLKTQKYLAQNFGAGKDEKETWYKHWTVLGMRAIEGVLEVHGKSSKYALGEKVSVADICLIPNMYSMRRFNVDLDRFPICLEIEKNCLKLEAFQKASPEMQIDAPEGLEQIHGPNSPVLKRVAEDMLQ